MTSKSNLLATRLTNQRQPLRLSLASLNRNFPFPMIMPSGYGRVLKARQELKLSQARAQAEPRKPHTKDPNLDVDVSNWLDTDFQALSLAGPMATGETEPRKPQTQDDLCDVDVSDWMDIAFANQTN